MAPHRALLLALPVAVLLGVALVVFLLALGQGELELDLVGLPVRGGRDQGVALALDLADQLVDLVPVQQQLARAAVVGDDVRVLSDRGRPLESTWAPTVLVTVHPSSILRQADSARRKEAFEAFVADLRIARTYLPAS